MKFQSVHITSIKIIAREW